MDSHPSNVLLRMSYQRIPIKEYLGGGMGNPWGGGGLGGINGGGGGPLGPRGGGITVREMRSV